MEQCGAKTWLQLAWWSPCLCSHCRPPPFKKLLLITTRVTLSLSLLGCLQCHHFHALVLCLSEFYKLFRCWVCLNLHPLCKHSFNFFYFWFKCSYFCINLNFINYPAVGFVAICILHVNKASISFLCSFRCFCNRGNREVVKMWTGGF